MVDLFFLNVSLKWLHLNIFRFVLGHAGVATIQKLRVAPALLQQNIDVLDCYENQAGAAIFIRDICNYTTIIIAYLQSHYRPLLHHSKFPNSVYLVGTLPPFRVFVSWVLCMWLYSDCRACVLLCVAVESAMQACTSNPLTWLCDMYKFCTK